MIIKTGLYKKLQTYFVNGHSWFVNPNKPIRLQLEEVLEQDKVYIQRLTERVKELEKHLAKVDVDRYNPRKKYVECNKNQ